MIAGARVDINESKRDELDFALWKSAKPGEPSWESPWGPGRPGWHIECSVMSAKYLGESFDIHGGGIDLVFPHHENEIAQAEAATGKTPFTKYWMHNGHVTTKGEKISKSLGNFLPIPKLIERWHPEAIRLFLLSHNYRSPVDLTDDALDTAQEHVDRFYEALAKTNERVDMDGKKNTPLPESGEELKIKLEKFRGKFEEAMDFDFNTAEASAAMMDLLKVLNRFLDQCKPSATEHRELLASTAETLKTFGGIMGMLDENPETYLDNRKQLKINQMGIDAQKVEELIKKRSEARAAKNWDEADATRDELLEMGVEIKDGPKGTTWGLK